MATVITGSSHSRITLLYVDFAHQQFQDLAAHPDVIYYSKLVQF